MLPGKTNKYNQNNAFSAEFNPNGKSLYKILVQCLQYNDIGTVSLHGVIESTEDSCIIMKDQTREHIGLSVAKIKAINPQQAQK